MDNSKVESLFYFIIGIGIGSIILIFVQPSNYTKNLVEDIKTDLNIDINKLKNE